MLPKLLSSLLFLPCSSQPGVIRFASHLITDLRSSSLYRIWPHSFLIFSKKIDKIPLLSLSTFHRILVPQNTRKNDQNPLRKWANMSTSHFIFVPQTSRKSDFYSCLWRHCCFWIFWHIMYLRHLIPLSALQRWTCWPCRHARPVSSRLFLQESCERGYTKP